MTWKAKAQAAMDELIDLGKPFSSDDLIDMVGPPDVSHTPNSRNGAVGSLFNTAARQGRIVDVGHERSRQPHRKSGLIRLWQAPR